VVLDASPGQAALPGRILGQVRVRVTPTDPARSVFVGIAPSAQIDRYLAGVARTVPGTGWRSGTDIAGSAPATPPTELAIWDAQVVGSGTQELFWTPRAGTWGVVLMNADASVGVSVSASVGAELPWLGPVGALCLVLGILLLAGGVTAVAVAVHRARRSPPTLT
jgi:hypothetical protein